MKLSHTYKSRKLRSAIENAIEFEYGLKEAKDIVECIVNIDGVKIPIKERIEFIKCIREAYKQGRWAKPEPPTKLYVVSCFEEPAFEDGDATVEFHSIWLSKDKADECAKNLWGGRVDEREPEDKP